METRATAAVTRADLNSLQALLMQLQQKINDQEKTIQDLQESNNAYAANAQVSSANRMQSLKAPSIPSFSAKPDERTSEKVKGFIYNVTKVGALSNMDDARLLALAECHFQDRAAAWMMRLEQASQKPKTVAELQTAMISEFVPPDEKARAKVKLMNCQMKGAIEKHINVFQELVEICGTPVSEAYIFLFMSLPGSYKEELTKKFSTEDPIHMLCVYEHVRTIDRARLWAGKDSGSKPGTAHTVSKSADTATNPTSDKRGKKSDGMVSWGPVKAKERSMYRAADRCMKCGKKSWSDENHPCRIEWEAKHNKGHPKD